MKKFLALILAGVMCMGVTSCGEQAKETENEDKNPKKVVKDNTNKVKDEVVESTLFEFEDIKKKGELVVGITEYEPMDFRGEDGEWTGFDAEFAEAVAEKMGVNVKFIEIDWDNKFLELDSKSIDCIWNGMTITDEVINNTSCSIPYAKNEQVIVMSKDKVGDYKDLDSVKELVFAVESGSAAEAAAEEMGLNIVAVKAQTDTLMEVKSGSTDACIIDATMADSMIGEGTSYADLAKGIPLTKEEYGIGFRKGSDLKTVTDGYIKELKEDGTLAGLAEKYSISLAD